MDQYSFVKMARNAFFLPINRKKQLKTKAVFDKLLLILDIESLLNLFFDEQLLSNSDILLIPFALRGYIASILLDQDTKQQKKNSLIAQIHH